MYTIFIGLLILILLTLLDIELIPVGLILGLASIVVISIINSPSDKIEIKSESIKLGLINGKVFRRPQIDNYVMMMNGDYIIIPQNLLEIRNSDSTFYEAEYEYKYRNYNREDCNPHWYLGDYSIQDTVKTLKKIILYTDSNNDLFD